jgi:hypothetical protein
LGAETVPRFAPSADALGSAFAEEILDQLRKELESVDLKTSPKRPSRGKRS